MLKGKVAVITGGTRGIGLATVRKFLQNGATVAVLGSRQETVDRALHTLKEENPDYPVVGYWPNLVKYAEVEEFKIVTTVRGNSLKNLISTESPIGKAVLGHKVGDRVWVEINANAGYYVEIKTIKEADPGEEEKLRSF